MKPLLLLLPLSLSAQEILPEVIITASRTPEKTEDLPYTTQLLSAEDLLNAASRTLPQAFLDTPGVLVQQSTTAHGSPYIRGFTGRQNLLLQDGIRLNNATWRGGPVQYWNTLDSQAISQVELIKSQGSVLYGSDAIGGTVNVLSKDTGFRDEEGFFSKGAAYYRFDTNSKSHLGRLEQALGIAGQWGLMLGSALKDIGDIKDSAIGRMIGTGYREHSYDLKFQYAFSDSRTLTIAHSALDQDDISRWHNTIHNPGWRHGSSVTSAGSDLARDYDQERSLSYLRLEDDASDLYWLDSWQATLSFQKTQDSELRVRSSGRTDQRILDVDTYGITLQGQSGDLTWGADYYHDRVDSQGFRNGVIRESNRPVADDSSYHSLGLFAHYSGSLTDRLTYNAGARYTHASAKWSGYRPADAAADQAGKSTWDNLSLSLRGQYQLDEQWTLFGGASQAFRAPNLDDLTGSQFALNGLDSNGSPDIDPETYLTAELGTRFDNGDLSFQLSGYYTFIDDGIVRIEAPANTLTTTNGSDGYLCGIEAQSAWDLHPDWQLSAHASWQDGKQSTNGVQDRIRRLNPLSGALSLKWTDPADRYWISGRLQAATRQDKLSTLAARDSQRIPSNGTPSYLTASLYAAWQVSDALQLNLALENLSDEDYRIHGSGQNQAGRNATISVKFAW